MDINKKLLHVIIIVIIVTVAIGFWAFSSPRDNIITQNGASLLDSVEPTPTPPAVFHYIEIHDACDWASVGPCVNMRNGPGTQYAVKGKLRNGVVLKIDDSEVVDGLTWYRVVFGSEIRYPERVEGDLYVADSDSVRYFEEEVDTYATRVNATSTKKIIVDVSEQTLYAYEDDSLFMKQAISTGLEFTPTPRGNFFVRKKTPARYMQGPIPEVSDQYYDLPGVPWDLYFTSGGAVIHGAYWHNNFGERWSHGCVNLPVEQAQKLYYWAEAGTPVVIQD